MRLLSEIRQRCVIAFVLVAVIAVVSGGRVLAQAGAPDPAFQVQDYSPQQICLQSDGKILLDIPGTEAPSALNPTIVRLNNDGTVDSSFILSDESQVAAPAYLSSANGYIYLVSYNYINGSGPYGSTLERFNESTGDIDATFAAVTVPGTTVQGYLVQSDGKILVWGDATYRRNADGTMDSSFTAPTFDTTPSGFSETSSGQLYAWGYFSTVGTTARNGFARLNTDGSLDTNFVPATAAGSYALAPVIQESSGSVLITLWDPASSRHTLFRLNSDGTLDTTFQSPTFVFYLEIGQTAFLNAIETPDQKIMIWGNMDAADTISIPGYTRLNQDGSMDSAFAANATTGGTIGTILVQPDGKLVLAGSISTGTPLLRLNTDGTLDTTFDMQSENQLGSTLSEYQTFEPILQPDGKILAGLVPIYVDNSGYGDGGVIVISGGGLNPTPPPPPDLIVRYDAYGSYPPRHVPALTVDAISPQLTRISWTAVADADAYQIQREEDGQWIAKGTVTGDTLSYDDTTVDGTTNFPYRVVAQNAAGSAWPSPSAVAVIPGTFTLTSVPISATEIDLSWTAATDAWRYDIYRTEGTLPPYKFSVSNPGATLTRVGSVSGSTVSYADTTAQPMKTYTYAVVATNMVGATDSTSVALTPAPVLPLTPAYVQAAALGPNNISITWRAAPGATGYEVERSLAGSGVWQVLTAGGNMYMYGDSLNLIAGQTYDYRITALNGANSSAASTIVSVVAPDQNWRPPGTLDPSFAPNPPLTNVQGVKISPSGTIYYLYLNPFTNVVTLGAVDPTGASVNFNPGLGYASVLDFAPLNNGDVLISTATYNGYPLGRPLYGLYLLTATGAVDRSVTLPTNLGCVANLYREADGKVLLGCSQLVNNGGSYADSMIRVNQDGSADPSFAASANFEVGLNFVVQSNGGAVYGDGFYSRNLPDGLPDTNFGDAGLVGSDANYTGLIAIGPDDKIVVADNFTRIFDGTQPVPAPTPTIARLMPDGKLDTTFNPGSGFSGGFQYGTPSAVLVDHNGRIIVIGQLFSYNGMPVNSVVRLMPDGSFDPSFVLPSDFDSSNFFLSPDGKSFYAGTTLQRFFYNPTTNAPAISFNQWASSHAVTGSMTTASQPDGVPNLLKYFCDIDPSKPISAADRSALPSVGVTSDGGAPCLTLTYRQNALLSNISVEVQTSSDMVNWQTVPNPNAVQVNVDVSSTDPIMQVEAPITGAAQFIRLKLTSP